MTPRIHIAIKELRRAGLPGCHDEIALVLTAFVVDHDDHLVPGDLIHGVRVGEDHHFPLKICGVQRERQFDTEDGESVRPGRCPAAPVQR